MKKINENTKVTLTLNQLKKLVKEAKRPVDDFDTKSNNFEAIFKKLVLAKLGRKYWSNIGIQYETNYYSIAEDFDVDGVDDDADDFDEDNCGYVVMQIFCGDDGGDEYDDVYPLARAALKQVGLRIRDERIDEYTNGFDFLFRT